MLWRNLVTNYRLALEVALPVAVVVGVRALLFAVGLQGISAARRATPHVARLRLAHMAGRGILAPPSSFATECPARPRSVWGSLPGRHSVMA